MMPDYIPKSMKSDGPDLEKWNQTIVLSSILVAATHVHRMQNQIENGCKIKAKTSPNLLTNDTHYAANKKR